MGKQLTMRAVASGLLLGCTITVSACSSLRGGDAIQGRCSDARVRVQEKPAMYVTFAGATADERLDNLIDFDSEYVSEVLRVTWLTYATDQKSEAYFLLDEYPSKARQRYVRDKLMGTGLIASVRFGPIAAKRVGGSGSC